MSKKNTVLEYKRRGDNVQRCRPRQGRIRSLMLDAAEGREVPCTEVISRLASIVDFSDDAIIGKRLDGTITDWNNGAERIYGYTSDEILGRAVSILVPSDRPDELPEILDRIKRGERVDHIETVRVAKNGQMIDVSLSVSPIKDGEGKVIGASTIARDITERKRADKELQQYRKHLEDLVECRSKELKKTIEKLVQEIADRKAAEKAIRESEERFRSVFEDAGTAMGLVNKDGTFRMVNSALCEVFGCSEEELLRMKVSDFSCPDEASQWSPVIHSIWSGETASIRMQRRYRHKNGQMIVGEVTISPVHNAEAEVTHLMGQIVDITERKQAEEALNESERSLAEAQSIALIGSWDWDITGDKLSWSDETFRQMGLNPGEITPTYGAFEEFVHPDDRERVNKAVEHALYNKGSYSIEAKMIRADGTEWLMYARGKVSRDEDDTSVRFIGTQQDITERKQAEEVLERKHAELRERVKELDCLYGLSQIIGDSTLSQAEVLQKAVNLLPGSWQYPEVTCAKIVIDDIDFTTANYQEAAWKQTAKVYAYGACAGSIEVAYCEERPELSEGPFLREERLLIDGVASALGQYLERRQTQDKLQKASVRLRKSKEALEEVNRELVAKQKTLEEKNVVLSGVLEQVEVEKRQIRDLVQANLERMVLPLISTLKDRIDPAYGNLATLLESCLKDIATPFLHRLETEHRKLSPSEIEICGMIKNGFDTKQIASLRNVSALTISDQRKAIRKKLGIANTAVNLATYLKQLNQDRLD